MAQAPAVSNSEREVKEDFSALRSDLDSLRKDFGTFVGTLKSTAGGRAEAELDAMRERIATLGNELQATGQQQLRKVEGKIEERPYASLPSRSRSGSWSAGCSTDADPGPRRPPASTFAGARSRPARTSRSKRRGGCGPRLPAVARQPRLRAKLAGGFLVASLAGPGAGYAALFRRTPPPSVSMTLFRSLTQA